MYNDPMSHHNEQELPLAEPLTPREQEILSCLGEGLSNRQIAEQLTLSLNTVKWYVRQVYNKLGVSSRSDAVARAMSLGLLPATEQEGGIRHNLPAAITPFVGREDELSALAKLIAEPQVRIVTIIGPGGMGKTRLALEAAGRELGPGSIFPDGIFFIYLAPIDSVEEIIATIATALEFHFQGASEIARTETQQILDFLKNKKMLLVMDNFEQILDGRTLLIEIIEQAPEIRLLVTSRERLQLRGEQLYPLQGLGMPETADSGKEALARSPAAQLFLNISRRTVPDFRLLEGDAEKLLRICRLVDGMPLGLELAASWIGLLPLSGIADEIERSLYLLTTEHHDVPERHRSMQATLDASWRRLSSDQQLGFQELSVFRGGFTRSAAFRVADVTLPLLVTLVNKSWLSYDREGDRYNVHELLRQFGAAKLSSGSVHEKEVHERFDAYFCSYLKDRETDWFGARQKEAASEVRDEIDNLQTAWRRAADQSDVDLLAQGLNSLCRFYQWEGRMKDGEMACHAAGDGLSKWRAERRTDDVEGLALWSQVLAWESEFIHEAAKKEELLSKSQQLLDRAAASGSDVRSEQAFTYLRKAQAAEFMDIDEAIHLHELGLKLYRELGDVWGEAKALGKLGGNLVFKGDLDRATNLLRENSEICRQLNDSQGIAHTTVYLGFSARFRGNFEKAESLHRQSLNLFQQLGNRWSERICLSVLSLTLTWSGKFDDARETGGRALELDRDLGQYPNPASLCPVIEANMHLGHAAEAELMAAETLQAARKGGRLIQQSWALKLRGSTALAAGNLADAERHILESAALVEEAKHMNRAVPRAIQCYVARAQGDSHKVREYLTNVLRSTIEFQSILPFIYCLPIAALIAADDGQSERAIELYSLAKQYGHITNSRWFDEIACKELDSVLASLPPEVASAAEARGRVLDVWETADQLLLDMVR
jgi:DNA-binding CsgD family transcriptional regulator/tetratricopeptide (TPR) repeat protein